LERLLGPACDAECDVSADAFEPDFFGFVLGPVELFFEDSLSRTVHGLVVPHPEDPDAVFGTTNVWADHGFPLETDRRTERRWSIRTDVEGQVTRSLRMKSGVEWTWMDLAARSGALAENGSLEFWDVDPQVGAAYVQGRVNVGDLVFHLGLRWDHWNPNTTFPLFPGHVDCSISPVPRRLMDCFEGMPVARAPTRNELAPRLGVAFPITDRSQMRLSFGRFHQLPQLGHFFRNHRSHLVVARGGFGNPLLEHVETTALEVGLTRVLDENLALEVAAYHRNRRGAIRLDLFPPERIAPTVREVATFVNADNGNVKGVDLTLRQRLAAYWAFDLAWSLQWARGTTSSPTAFIDKGFGLLFDPRFPERRLEPPTELSPEDFDRLHSFNGRLELRLPPGWRDGTTLGSLFEDTSLYAVYTAHSGEPYTRTAADGSGSPIEDFNASRLPWSHRGDLRVAKGFELASSIGVDVFALVRNFLDGRDAVAVHPVTGRTDREGLEDQLKLDPFISSRFRTNGTAGNDFPLALDDIAAEHRAALGRQDRDGDGVITREEAIASLGDALVAQSDVVFHYGEPRQFRFGVEVRF
jgi:outer membrane receptor protein involved in Fe transport